MELITLTASLIFFLSIIYFLLKSAATRIRKSNQNSPPEAAGGWPIFGHLNLLSGPEQPHITLANLADKYGPLYSIRLGIHRCLVVSSWEVAKEIFNSTNDVIFSNRPQTVALQLMSYDFAMFGFSRYSDYWRELRKISTQKLLSRHMLSKFGASWEIETRAMMKSIYLTCEAPLDMKRCLKDLSLNSMVSIVSGATVKKMDLEKTEDWQEHVKEFFRMMGVLTFADVVPYLKWLDYFKGTIKDCRKTGKVMDNFLQSWVEQHKKLQGMKSEIGGEDIMEIMMASADSIAQQFPRYDADSIVKATCQTMMLGGTDSMTITLTWALCLLLNNPHTLKLAQDELDKHIGKCRQVKESDIENLVYIKGIVKETLRLQPPVPVIPREASEDCTVAGYFIPAGTRLFVNLWKIQRDPRVWPNPTEFQPQRFLGSHKEVDVQGLHFELLPFGSGRRVCPAVSFSLQALQLALATFLHGFDISTASGESVDMTGSFGTTNPKATPLEVVLKLRLSREIYA